MKADREVVITGIGCLCGAGPDLEAAMASLFAGRRAPRPPRGFTTDHPKALPVFEVPDAYLPPHLRDAEHLLRTSRLGLAAAEQALAAGGLHAGGAGRGAVCMGTTVGSAMNNEAFYRDYRHGGRPSMAAIDRYLASNPAAVIGRRWQAAGPCQTVVNACSSGTDAIGIGAGWIRAGVCDWVLAGGCDELCRVTYDGFAALQITDAAPCRPFDRQRRGLNLGEAAGVLLLEGADHAARRGAPVRGTVRAFGTACDAYHLTAPEPNGRGLRAALGEALERAGVAPREVAFVNAHGTGTPDNDRVEGRVLGDLLPGVPFVSTKGYTGHTLGAAGAIEAAFTVACLEQGRIPGNAGLVEPDPELPAAPSPDPREVRGAFAVSQSLAFGGNNSVLVLGLPPGRGRP